MQRLDTSLTQSRHLVGFFLFSLSLSSLSPLPLLHARGRCLVLSSEHIIAVFFFFFASWDFTSQTIFFLLERPLVLPPDLLLLLRGEVVPDVERLANFLGGLACNVWGDYEPEIYIVV